MNIIKFTDADGRERIMGEDDYRAKLLSDAAPDLLAALREMIDEHGQRGLDDVLLPKNMQPREIWKAFDAIAKAEGRL